jgi:hypothetical protein
MGVRRRRLKSFFATEAQKHREGRGSGFNLQDSLRSPKDLEPKVPLNDFLSASVSLR